MPMLYQPQDRDAVMTPFTSWMIRVTPMSRMDMGRGSTGCLLDLQGDVFDAITVVENRADGTADFLHFRRVGLHHQVRGQHGLP